MIVPTLDNIFFSNLARHVEQILREKEMGALVCSSENNASREKALIRELSDRGTDGLICISGLNHFPKDTAPNNFPIVWVDRKPTSERAIPWVANDDKAAMENATEYLLKKGCRHILLLPGFLAEPRKSPRVIGYQAALVSNGFEVDPQYILNRKGEQPTEIETEKMVRDLLRKGVPVDGIITSSDRSAFGAMAGLRSVGLYVPEDVKLISFDNSPYSAMATPSITALDRKPELLAAKACENLIQMVNGETVPLESIVDVTIVERVSTM